MKTKTANSPESVDIASHIELLRVSAHPVRIKILEELARGVKCVSDFEEFLEISQPNISQHLAALRHAGIIDFYTDGRLRCYFLKSPFILNLLKFLKKNYEKELPGPECCPVTKKGKYPGDRQR
ncbi:MAG: winged helix-turn-helix transcriptional regulator [Nitrospirae bacterium]|nr:winged helix-turn-helix transcriptional regulator [Nitrospirota bacterium]